MARFVAFAALIWPQGLAYEAVVMPCVAEVVRSYSASSKRSEAVVTVLRYKGKATISGGMVRCEVR